MNFDYILTVVLQLILGTRLFGFYDPLMARSTPRAWRTRIYTGARESVVNRQSQIANGDVLF